jgi:drug/metabolite transporter (DMT)-like permease
MGDSARAAVTRAVASAMVAMVASSAASASMRTSMRRGCRTRTMAMRMPMPMRVTMAMRMRARRGGGGVVRAEEGSGMDAMVGSPSTSTSGVGDAGDGVADADEAGAERVGRATGAERAIPSDVVVDERGVECVGVGMDASCDVDLGGEVEMEVATQQRRRRMKTRSVETSSATSKTLGGAALVAPFFLWGTSMVAMKGVLPATSPMFVATIRLIPAGALLVAWALSKGRPMPKTGAAWGAIAAFALVDATMFQGCLAEGLQRTSAGLGSVIIDSQPLTVAVLASLLFGETLGAEGVAGLMLGVLGLVLLEAPPEVLRSILNGDGPDATMNVLNFDGNVWDSGEWWMLLAAQSMAVGTVMVRWVCKYVDPVMATGWHMVLGGVPLLAYSIASEPEMYANMHLSGGDVASLAYASVFGGAVAYGAFFYFASKGSLTKLSSLTFLTPMFATALGYFALGETLDETQLAGALVTLVGIYFVNTRAKEAEPAKK